MKKCLLISLLILSPSLLCALPLSYFNIQRAYLEKLDPDSYRLRVLTDWGGDQWVGQYGYLVGNPSYSPELNYLRIGPVLGTSQYNPTHNSGEWGLGYNSPGEWYGGNRSGWAYGLGLNEHETLGEDYWFGYDFDWTGPTDQPLWLSYDSRIEWGGWVGYEYGYTENYQETHSGTFAVEVIPEPATLLLVGLGLTGLFIGRYRAHRQH